MPAATVRDSEASGGVVAVVEEDPSASKRFAQYLGGLIGRSEGDVVGSGASGGVSAHAEGSGAARRAEFRKIGGLVGGNSGGRITQSAGAGTVRLTGHVAGDSSASLGGLVGWNDGGVVEYSHALVWLEGFLRVGGLVGRNEEGEVTDSFSSGVVLGRESFGGLVGWNEGLVQDSFSTALVRGVGSGTKSGGGLVGFHYEGRVHRTLASGEVRVGTAAGGLAGSGMALITHSFAAGGVMAGGEVANSVGGLVGSQGGIVREVYALGMASCGPLDGECVLGGLVGSNFSTSPLQGGVLRRAYYNSDAYGAPADVPIVVGDHGADADDNPLGQASEAASKTEAELRALSCADNAFRWDHDGDDPDEDGFWDHDGDDPDGDGTTEGGGTATDEVAATARVSCTEAGAGSFPWDFGTAPEQDANLVFPVLRGLLGGVLDAEGQRSLIAFARTDHAQTATIDRASGGTSVAVTLTAPVAVRSEGHTLSYRWHAVDGGLSFSDVLSSSPVVTVATEGKYSISLSVIERDGGGVIRAVYGDELVLTVDAN